MPQNDKDCFGKQTKMYTMLLPNICNDKEDDVNDENANNNYNIKKQFCF